MHRLLIFAGLVLFSAAPFASAQPSQFPYEAEVVSRTGVDTLVRSGPGKRYYPTSSLKPGERVTVRRHDPGGWYMIDPPAGSFSWIRADYVQKNGHTGTVTEPNVVARVGSAVEPDRRDVEQIRLSRGDNVTIIGEQTFVVEGRAVLHYKIAPPRFEYRWMMGQFLVPIDATRRRQATRDPYWSPPAKDATDESLPSGDAPPPSTNQASAHSDHRPRDFDDAPKPSETYDTNRPIASSDTTVGRSDPFDQRGIERIDDEFRRMIDTEPTFWNLDHLEREYETIQAGTNDPSIARQIAQRLAAVDRYRKTQRDYEDFMSITRATNERNAQLLATQQQPLLGQPTAMPNQPIVDAPPPGSPVPDPAYQQGYANRPVTPSAPAPGPQRPLDGAGIVQRSATTFPSAPQHVLLAPNGRILSYLRPIAGVNLDEHIGQERGIYGSRRYDQSLRADLIDVQGLIPVRLQTSSPASR